MKTINKKLKINRPKARVSAIGFADNTNILTYSTSTEANCRTLEGVYT